MERTTGRDNLDADIASLFQRFCDCDSLADRLAMLREVVRRQGGRRRFERNGQDWLAAHRDELARFGLEIVDGGASVALRAGDHTANAIPDFVFRLIEQESANAIATCAPDAFLLRSTNRSGYRSIAQKAAVRAVVTMPESATLMVGLPTGGGKSLCFQTLALLEREADPHAFVLLIVPTIALALDHERSLKNFPGLDKARCLTGDQPTDEKQAIVEATRRGEVPILITSPEKALDLKDVLTQAADRSDGLKTILPGRLAAIAIDEAHMVEDWGRSFRPAFQHFATWANSVRSRHQVKILLLSATLSPSTEDLLRASYKRDGDWLYIDGSEPRYEFSLSAKSFQDGRVRDAVLLEAVDLAPRPTIVYVTEVDRAKEVFRRLTNERGYQRIGLFTGETPQRERRDIVQRWSENQIDLMVATSAFGMGIDKADVRTVIHACLPETTARYYQEIGRAGRDGNRAFGIALWTKSPAMRSDESLARRMAIGDNLSSETAKARWRALERSGIWSWTGDGRRLGDLDLKAAHAGVNVADSDYNINWNRHLLLSMQRANAIEVVEGDGDDGTEADRWTIVIQHDEIVEADADNPAWKEFDRFIRHEASRGQSDHEHLKGLLEGQKDCLLIGAFQSIVPDAIDFPPCGHCDYCLRRGLGAPEERTRARPKREGGWRAKATAPASHPPGIHLLTYEGARERRALLESVWLFARGGAQHFVVPPEDATSVAKRLSKEPLALGLVDPWPADPTDLDPIEGCPLFLMPPEFDPPDSWWPVVDHLRGLPGKAMVMVAVPARARLAGRPITSATIHPPITLESLLDGAGQAEPSRQ